MNILKQIQKWDRNYTGRNPFINLVNFLDFQGETSLKNELLTIANKIVYAKTTSEQMNRILNEMAVKLAALSDFDESSFSILEELKKIEERYY